MPPAPRNADAVESALHFCEQTIPLDPALAEVFSVNKALLIQQLHFLLHISRDKPEHTFEGFTWVWETYDEWSQQCRWLSSSTIRENLTQLVKQGVVLKKEMNPHQYKRVLYYRLDYDVLARIMTEYGYEQSNVSYTTAKNWQPETTNSSSSSGSNWQLECAFLNTSLIGTETSTNTSANRRELVVS